MSEEKDSSLSQEELKDKLKDMGVMQDEHSAPHAKKKSFLKDKWLIIFAVVVALGFWWWYTDSQEATDTVADSSGDNTSTIATPYPQPLPQSNYQTADNYPTPPAYPSPYPNPYAQNYPYGPAPDADKSSESAPQSELSEPPQNGRWDYPQNRRDDRYGPPPGWGPYGYPPGPGYYAPPPQYYGQPYYGPRPNWQLYGPPPPGYFYPPPPRYTPNY